MPPIPLEVQHVNDRAWLASSLPSVDIAQVLVAALAGDAFLAASGALSILRSRFPHIAPAWG